jgi:hypothetical protein
LHYHAQFATATCNHTDVLFSFASLYSSFCLLNCLVFLAMVISRISLAVRAEPITSHNKTTAITIATLLLLATLIIVVLSREAIKFTVLRKFQSDDFLILFATLFAIGHTVSALILASNGLGKEEVSLTLKSANIIQKAYYSSDLLYISSICFGKLSLIAFFHGIKINTLQRRLVQVFGAFILVWSTVSLVAVAFQCGLPRPWEVITLHCYDRGYFWMIYCIIDMTTDVAIIMMSVNLVAYLKVELGRKIAVVACFAPRIFVIGAAISRLIYLFPITPRDNPKFDLWIPLICAQVQVCLSVSTACIPYMKPFFEGVEAGVWRSDHFKREGMATDEWLSSANSGHPMTGQRIGRQENRMLNISIPTQGRVEPGPRIATPTPISPLIPSIFAPTDDTTSRNYPPQGLRLHIPSRRQSRTSRILSPQNYTPRFLPSSSPRPPQTPSSPTLSPQDPSPAPLMPQPLRYPERQPPQLHRRQISNPRAPRRHPERSDVRIPIDRSSAALVSARHSTRTPNPQALRSPPPVFRVFPQPRPYRPPSIPQVPRLPVQNPQYLAPPGARPRQVRGSASFPRDPRNSNLETTQQQSASVLPSNIPRLWREGPSEQRPDDPAIFSARNWPPVLRDVRSSPTIVVHQF